MYKCRFTLQGLLLHVIEHQPEDPITYFHEEITKIKKEMEDSNVSRFVWSCMGRGGGVAVGAISTPCPKSLVHCYP